MILYDRLRPIIIHVIHIETLAELCSILKTEILMENIKTNGSLKNNFNKPKWVLMLIYLFS